METETELSALGRRRFLATVVQAACAAGAVGAGLVLATRQAAALPATALRPPGALPEEKFLGACVRCGLCVRDCPYNILKPAPLGDETTIGTPYFEARKIPCEMCETIPCVKACPSGALDKGLTDINKARMGVAVLVGRETCLNLLGLRCDVCYRVCPLIDQAITLEPQHNLRTGRHALFVPTVHTDKCTGCGKCEKSCPLEEAAIKVLPARLALGKRGGHYLLGWEEKKKRGEALIKDVIELPTRGQELIPEPRRAPAPFQGTRP
jgi:ferredoxin-type protein NapG